MKKLKLDFENKFNSNGKLICDNVGCWHRIPGGNTCVYDFNLKISDSERMKEIPHDCPYSKEELIELLN